MQIIVSSVNIAKRYNQADRRTKCQKKQILHVAMLINTMRRVYNQLEINK